MLRSWLRAARREHDVVIITNAFPESAERGLLGVVQVLIALCLVAGARMWARAGMTIAMGTRRVRDEPVVIGTRSRAG
jgi:hypothetical protein